MKTIWKALIPITDEHVMSWPVGSVPLTLQMQFGNLGLWYLCDPDAPTEERTVWVVGTGNPAPAGIQDAQYLGSVQMMGGALVWHCFMKAS